MTAHDSSIPPQSPQLPQSSQSVRKRARAGHPPRTGILVVDKPAGITSRDAVNQVQRLVRPGKVGHAGTLDPLATGVLVICLGNATRLISYVQKMRKSYRATFQLGVNSETDDIESTLTPVEGVREPTRGQIEAALENSFTGEILQTPPRYSALKLQGRRAYELARQNVDFQLQPRSVTIHAIELIAYEFPLLELQICCSSGTYIRSVGRDLGQILQVGGVMSALRREAVGEFRVEHALPIGQMTPDSLEHSVLPAQRALVELPAIRVSTSAAARLRQGRSIPIQEAQLPGISTLDNPTPGKRSLGLPIPSDVTEKQSTSLEPLEFTRDASDGEVPVADSEIVVLDPQGELVAIVKRVGQDDLQPHKCFPAC